MHHEGLRLSGDNRAEDAFLCHRRRHLCH
jgi:hypothetical protein